MKRTITKKKESGAEGRKMRKREAAEAEKSSKVLMRLFKKPAPSVSTVESEDGSKAQSNGDPKLREKACHVGSMESENDKVHRFMESDAPEFIAEHDIGLQLQIEKEKQKWRDILMRILHGIKYLTKQNLALRGHRESLQADGNSNVGNFLGLMKFLAVFDPVMREHLALIESHPYALSYISPGVQNEFIHIMASTVRKNLLDSIKKAKYYGLLFDSTPDQAHREQISEVVRFVDIDFERKTVCVRESFLGFLHIRQKDAASFVEVIMQQLEKDQMKIEDCRSQCYDNAAVMAGHRSGVQQRINEKNKLAVFVNCDNHSLNLVGVQAARQDTEMVSFFGVIDSLYSFFSRSTQRWEKLKDAVPLVLKAETESRWSSRTEAVKPVQMYLDKIVDVLDSMIEDVSQTIDTQSDAKQLVNRILTYEFLTLLGFWHKILTPIDRVQKRLQDKTMNFHNAALDIKGLRDHFNDARENLVDECLEDGKNLCEKWDVEIKRRTRGKTRMAGENARDAGLSRTDEMKRVMKGALDRLHKEMDDRFSRLFDIDSKFGFLLDVQGLCYGPDSSDCEQLESMCENLGAVYSPDIDGKQLYEEIIDCKMLISSRANLKLSRPEDLLTFIVEYGDESVFPNLRIALQIMLTMAVSIASCERSFSKLKLILSCLRASMSQDRLCDLAFMTIEREELEKTNFDKIIDEFASIKARKVLF